MRVKKGGESTTTAPPIYKMKEGWQITMRKFKSLLCVLLALMMAVTLFGCGGSVKSGQTTASAPAQTTASAPAKTTASAPAQATASAPAKATAAKSTADNVVYTIGVSGYLGRFIQGLNPVESPVAGMTVFDQIFQVNPLTKKIESDCLTEWSWEDDTTFVMKLNKNVVFSNGDKATAADLLYSYTSFFDRKSSDLSGFGLVLDKCVTRDDYTVVLKFEKPYRLMTNIRINLIDKAWSQKVGWDSVEWYKPVGSGPYVCTDYVVDDHMTLKARDNYWNAAKVGPIYVDEYKIQYYKDPATMQMDLEVGKIDFCELQATDYSRYLKSGGNGYKCVKLQAGVTQFASFDMYSNDLWKDKKLREAVAVGVNWADVGKSCNGDLYIPADSMAPKDSPNHITPGVYKYDVEKAKQLLKEAGYSATKPLKLKASMMDTAAYKTFGESLQFQLSQIGVDYQLEFLDTAATVQKWSNPGFVDICAMWNINGSPTFDLYDAISRARMKRTLWVYRDIPTFNDLFDKMAFSVDEKVWTKATKDLQQYIFDEVLYIPYAELTSAFAYRTDRLTEQQVKSFTVASNMYQLDKLGYLSSWQ